MQKSLSLLFGFLIYSSLLFAQYNDPIYPKPSSGYGADGNFSVLETAFPNPNFAGEKIEIFHPANVSGPVPTLFFSHGYGGTFSGYVKGMLEFVAKKGYAIVFVPYPTTGVSIVERYDNLLAGFRKAARDYPDIIDTTKVGFMGHSFGGGALFGVSHRCFTENNWGSAGRFLFSLAPWYAYELTQAQLQSFPADTKLIMHVYEDDLVNDHRMAIDLFNNINIPAAEKDYIFVQSDTIQGNIYAADHGLPGTYQVFNALDYYAFYRLLDALCDYTFNGKLAGKIVALGNGNSAQTGMPTGLKPLLQTDAPSTIYPEDRYGFPCSQLLNPRRDYCVETTDDQEPTSHFQVLKIDPNPGSDYIHLQFPALQNELAFRVFNANGQVVLAGNLQNVSDHQLNISSLPAGSYWIVAGSFRARFSKVK